MVIVIGLVCQTQKQASAAHVDTTYIKIAPPVTPGVGNLSFKFKRCIFLFSVFKLTVDTRQKTDGHGVKRSAAS